MDSHGNTDRIRFSLIVPVYNGGEAFRGCVDSLLKLSFPAHQLQIILIDDGSTDGTGEWLQGLSLPGHIQVIQHPENWGRAAARNSGITHAVGEFVGFLDGDMLVEPDYIDQHLFLLTQPGVEAVAGHMVPASQLPRTRLQRYLFEYSGRGARQFGEDHPVPFQYLITGNMSLTRRALSAAGKFDESFQGYGGEDTLLAFLIGNAFPDGIRFSARAAAFDQQQYLIPSLLEKFQQYGKFNLPRLLDQYPQMRRALHADYITGTGCRGLLGKLILNPFIYRVSRWKYGFMPWPLSNWLIRLLIMNAIASGYRERIRL